MLVDAVRAWQCSGSECLMGNEVMRSRTEYGFFAALAGTFEFPKSLVCPCDAHASPVVKATEPCDDGGHGNAAWKLCVTWPTCDNAMSHICSVVDFSCTLNPTALRTTSIYKVHLEQANTDIRSCS